MECGAFLIVAFTVTAEVIPGLANLFGSHIADAYAIEKGFESDS